ncbi:MAG: ArnT family glycosyltransferase, partial [Candidatus Limnocylindrales bacterium]
MSASDATPAAHLRGAIAMGPADISLERRVSLLILAATPILFLLFLTIAPSVNPTFDDAKYVGVGRSFLDGNGPTTVFGVVFLKHSPLWPMMIVLPERLFGIHPIVTGHLINALSGAITILLVGYLGWRVRPALGAIAAVLFAALPYVFDIARTAGIDLPSIALTLAYIILGFSVVRTGSIWRAAVLGGVFAVAFLIKETILPFAIVPFLLGALWGIRWTNLVRTAAVTLFVASVGMSWWFVMYAGYTHEVYRADFPEWTLIPSAIGVVVIFALGLAAGPIARSIETHGWGAAVARRVPARVRTRTFLGWTATLAWFVLLTFFFGRTPKLLGASLFDPNQVAYMIVHSLGSVRLAFAFGLGSVMLVADLLRDRRRVAQTSIDVLIATICGIPLVLLVVGVGETPRHYIAELALVILVGTIGWYHGLLRLRERDRLTAVLLVVLAGLAAVILALSSIQRISPRGIIVGIVGVVAVIVAVTLIARWLRRRGRLAALGVMFATVVFVVGMGTLGVRAARLPGVADRNETLATADTIAWIKANIP